jgi:hypothetical protein
MVKGMVVFAVIKSLGILPLFFSGGKFGICA